MIELLQRWREWWSKKDGSAILTLPDLPRLSRRQFFGMAGGAIVGVAIAPELAELLSPRPTIILPSSAELASILKRAFVPKLVTQIYHSSPLMAALLKDYPGADLIRRPGIPTDIVGVYRG